MGHRFRPRGFDVDDSHSRRISGGKCIASIFIHTTFGHSYLNSCLHNCLVSNNETDTIKRKFDAVWQKADLYDHHVCVLTHGYMGCQTQNLLKHVQVETWPGCRAPRALTAFSRRRLLQSSKKIRLSCYSMCPLLVCVGWWQQSPAVQVSLEGPSGSDLPMVPICG